MLSTVDYLLLDYVSEYKIPLNIFVQPNVGEILNKPDHNLSTIELALRLCHLVNEELIIIANSGTCLASLNEISDTLKNEPKSNQYDFDKRFEVKLTEKGGNEWEHVFLPDWRKYWSTEVTFGETEHSEEEWLLEQANLASLNDIIEFRKKHLIVKDDKFSIKRITPWDATYWKRLPEVYQAYFIVIEDLIDEMPNDYKNELHNRLSSWRRNWKLSYDGTLELE
ncbi:hypothetical protein [Candidatus Albibeggiatoa sp. nov. BB20]|uniref:hypothetical protein n=1 Tax=Candidatus Albibeggiatoa sp. nov. BB20 TaxID=3162723 RepID=UPI0033655479